jgi:hypothetical protein
MRLWHYTCDHGRQAIGARGNLVPPPYEGANVAERFGQQFAWYDRDDRPVWLTAGNFTSTGIPHNPQMCDRSACRYLVTAPELAEPWLPSRCRAQAPRWLVRGLERSGDPAQWWIAQVPIPARLA